MNDDYDRSVSNSLEVKRVVMCSEESGREQSTLEIANQSVINGSERSNHKKSCKVTAKRTVTKA